MARYREALAHPRFLHADDVRLLNGYVAPGAAAGD